MFAVANARAPTEATIPIWGCPCVPAHWEHQNNQKVGHVFGSQDGKPSPPRGSLINAPGQEGSGISLTHYWCTTCLLTLYLLKSLANKGNRAPWDAQDWHPLGLIVPLQHAILSWHC